LERQVETEDNLFFEPAEYIFMVAGPGCRSGKLAGVFNQFSGHIKNAFGLYGSIPPRRQSPGQFHLS
jgi:hypothetical protein